MDTDQATLDAALEMGQRRLTTNAQLLVARQTLETSLIHSVDGGVFVLDYAFLAFVGMLLERQISSATLLDMHTNPIMVRDLTLFLETALEKYAVATNTYHREINRIRDSRNVAEITQYEIPYQEI